MLHRLAALLLLFAIVARAIAPAGAGVATGMDDSQHCARLHAALERGAALGDAQPQAPGDHQPGDNKPAGAHDHSACSHCCLNWTAPPKFAVVFSVNRVAHVVARDYPPSERRRIIALLNRSASPRAPPLPV